MFRSLSCGALGHKVAFEEQAALAQEFGFTGVELDFGYARKKGAGAVKDLLERHGLRPGSFHFEVAFRDNDSETAWAESLGDLARLAPLAAELGCRRCATWVPSGSDTLSFREYWARMLKRIRPAAEILDAYGIRAGLEFIGPRTFRAAKKHGFLYTMDGMRAAAAELGKNVGLLLDSWHWYTAQATRTDLEHLAVDDVVCVHLNDAPSGIPVTEQVDSRRELPAATGVIDLAGFLGALKNMGYEGPVMVEPFNQALREMNLRDALKATAASLDQAFAAAGVA